MLKIPEGILKGVDNGEWGGSLSFCPFALDSKGILVKSGNIKAIISLDGKIYFLEGLAHMDECNRDIFEQYPATRLITFTKVLDFDNASEAFAI